MMEDVNPSAPQRLFFVTCFGSFSFWCPRVRVRGQVAAGAAGAGRDAVSCSRTRQQEPIQDQEPVGGWLAHGRQRLAARISCCSCVKSQEVLSHAGKHQSHLLRCEGTSEVENRANKASVPVPPDVIIIIIVCLTSRELVDTVRRSRTRPTSAVFSLMHAAHICIFQHSAHFMCSSILNIQEADLSETPALGLCADLVQQRESQWAFILSIHSLN